MTVILLSLLLSVSHLMAIHPVDCNGLTKLELTRNNYLAWMEHIQPSPSELRWTEIKWQPNLKSGIALASEQGKPVLLWTMNGHPFGCT